MRGRSIPSRRAETSHERLPTALDLPLARAPERVEPRVHATSGQHRSRRVQIVAVLDGSGQAVWEEADRLSWVRHPAAREQRPREQRVQLARQLATQLWRKAAHRHAMHHHQ